MGAGVGPPRRRGLGWRREDLPTYASSALSPPPRPCSTRVSGRRGAAERKQGSNGSRRAITSQTERTCPRAPRGTGASRDSSAPRDAALPSFSSRPVARPAPTSRPGGAQPRPRATEFVRGHEHRTQRAAYAARSLYPGPVSRHPFPLCGPILASIFDPRLEVASAAAPARAARRKV